MGVPKFYRWLSERYPLINQVRCCNRIADFNDAGALRVTCHLLCNVSTTQAIDESTLLPECDNLYLDMNGSIHNATHGDGGVAKRLSDHDVMLALVNGIE